MVSQYDADAMIEAKLLELKARIQEVPLATDDDWKMFPEEEFRQEELRQELVDRLHYWAMFESMGVGFGFFRVAVRMRNNQPVDKEYAWKIVNDMARGGSESFRGDRALVIKYLEQNEFRRIFREHCVQLVRDQLH